MQLKQLKVNMTFKQMRNMESWPEIKKTVAFPLYGLPVL
jgi:hypothetical protein